jgi:hypothetical protein
MRNKLATSYRLTPDCLRLVGLLTKRLGLSQSSIIELAVRTLAKKEKV